MFGCLWFCSKASGWKKGLFSQGVLEKLKGLFFQIITGVSVKAIGYIRVSTRAQDENNQRLAIQRFAEKEGIEILTWYVDKGESRRKKWVQRPGARDMVEFLEKGGKDIVDAVIVFDLTRLGADMLDVLNLFNKLEKELGIRIISVHDKWLQMDDEKLRKLLIAIFAWVADMELRLRRERQEAAWAAGKQKGRPPKIKPREVEQYIAKYPTLSIADIAKIINADRKRKGKPEVSYWAVYKIAKKLGYTKVLTKKNGNRR